MSEVLQKGIGAVLSVNAETTAMRGLFSEIRNAGMHPIDPRDAHITLVDCAETKISVFSERDQAALNRARSEASRYLGSLPLLEQVFHPSGHELKPFGARAAIEIADDDEILAIRGYIRKIFAEEANLSISNRDYKPHLSVATKSRGMKGSLRQFKNAKKAKLPPNLHISGHDVNERYFNENPARQRSKKSYVNDTRLKIVS